MERAAWNEALARAENGNPAGLAALMREHGLPPYALERVVRLIITHVRSPKDDKRAKELAEAFEQFYRHEATHAELCERFNIKPRTLDNVLARNRNDVNQILRERNLLNLANRK